MITIVATGRVRDGSFEALEAIVRELVGASRSEEGNVSYDFYTDLTDPAKFTFIEVWRDQAAIDSHNATAHFQGFVKRAEPLFASPLEVALCRKFI